MTYRGWGAGKLGRQWHPVRPAAPHSGAAGGGPEPQLARRLLRAQLPRILRPAATSRSGVRLALQNPRDGHTVRAAAGGLRCEVQSPPSPGQSSAGCMADLGLQGGIFQLPDPRTGLLYLLTRLAGL